MEVFIVRPFGTKKVLKKPVDETSKPIDFDFEKVDKELITPAFKELNLGGGTTGKIFEPGDIREDMFSLLLLADIVIADITIHNANVFYELGIRHALRDRKTILLKCPGFDDTPFDIIGYRYLEYNKDDPGETLALLVATLRDTITTNRQDSPVFKMLPKLESQDPERFLAVPFDFTEEVRVTCETAQVGKLSLLALEAESFRWRVPALGLIGEGLYNLKALDLARIVWEKIKNSNANDRQANERLATIYQRLADREMLQNPVEGTALLAQSDIAIDNLLADYANLDKDKRAEVYALKARNTKTKWTNTWKDLPHDQKGAAALQSGYLEAAYKQYERGYYENLNHFYAGINALSLLTIMIALAESCPNDWAVKFRRQKDADQELDGLKEKKQNLSISVQMSIEAERRRLETTGSTDIWLSITEADFSFLTENNPERITAMYRGALQGAKAFHSEAAYRQIQIYEQLSILADKVLAAHNAIPAAWAVKAQITHYLLFTGHMIDQPDRKQPRFPPEKEASAQQKIKEKIENEIKNNADCQFRGIAGGACGGDLLFHEVCKELGIKTELYLALPHDQFICESVAFAGTSWVNRFNHLYEELPRQFLSQTPELPNWLKKKENYTIWERNNLWMLNQALANGGIHLTLIALWDGKGGDAAGGTEHIVQEAKIRGATTEIIDISKI